MRALKIVGLIAGGLVALLALGAIALLIWVNPNDYRGEIEQRVQSATGRPLQLKGELGLKVFPRLALQVNEMTLGNPPGYGAEPFLAVKSASLGMRLWPLLHKRFELSRISLDGLQVNLISRSDHDNNWKDLGESKDKEKESGESSAASISVAGVDVRHGVLVYRDEAKKKVTRLSELTVHTGALGGDAPVETHMELDYDEGGRRVAHVTTEARLAMPRDTHRIELAELAVKGQWFGSTPDKPTEFSISTPQLALDTEAQTLAPATLAVKWGELPVEVTTAGEKLFGEYIITGKLTVKSLSPRKLLPSLGMKPPVTRDPKVLSSFSFNGNYRLTEKTLALKGLDLHLDDTRVRGDLGIDDLDAVALSFNLAVDGINLDRYREPEVKSEGPKKSAPPTNLPLDALRKLNLHGGLRVGQATVADLKFDDIRTSVEADKGRVHLGPSQARLFGGGYQGDLVLDARPAQAKLSLNEHVRDIDIGQLVNAAFKTQRMTGRGDANAQLTGTGNTDAAILASLAGKIDANLKGGAFNGVDLWFELRRAIALVKGQPLPAAPQPARTVFKTFSGSATLANGILTNDDLRFDMDYLKARGRGTLALTDQAVDYHLVAEIYKLPAEGAGSELADLKALEIPISVTGTLAQLKVRPDVADLVKARLRKEVDKQLDKQKDELRKKLGDKLKGIFGN